MVARKEEVIITSENLSQVIQELIDQEHSEEFWNTLAERHKDFALRLAESQIQRERMSVIDQFEKDMVIYGDDEGHWQRFFEEHPWILQSAFSFTTFQLRGETCLGGKNCVGRNGQGGVATDFLFQDESTQSFAVIDIKTPATGLMAGSAYRGKKDAQNTNLVFAASNALSGGVIQVRKQIATAIDNFDHQLYRDFSSYHLNRVHPRGVLVIGCYDSLKDEQQKESFNLFRRGLFGLTVITFDELLRRLKQLYCIDKVDNSMTRQSKR